MTDSFLSAMGLDRPETGDDAVVPFTLEKLDTRGRILHLGPSLDAILTRHNYPAPVARLLGEAVVLSALIGSSLKFEGKLILQTQTDGPVNLIVVDFDAPDGLRGYARFDHDMVLKAAEEGRTTPADMLGRVLGVRVVEGSALLAQGAEVHQVHRVAGRADLAIDLVAALQLALIEGPERTLEGEAARTRVERAALGQGRRGHTDRCNGDD